MGLFDFFKKSDQSDPAPVLGDDYTSKLIRKLRRCHFSDVLDWIADDPRVPASVLDDMLTYCDDRT